MFREIDHTAPTGLCALARDVQYQKLNQQCREDNANIDVLYLVTFVFQSYLKKNLVIQY